METGDNQGLIKSDHQNVLDLVLDTQFSLKLIFTPKDVEENKMKDTSGILLNRSLTKQESLRNMNNTSIFKNNEESLATKNQVKGRRSPVEKLNQHNIPHHIKLTRADPNDSMQSQEGGIIMLTYSFKISNECKLFISK
jgi:hypothetical protein